MPKKPKQSKTIHILLDEIEGVLCAYKDYEITKTWGDLIAKESGLVYQGKSHNETHYGYEDEDRLAETPLVIMSIEIDDNAKVTKYFQMLRSMHKEYIGNDNE